MMPGASESLSRLVTGKIMEERVWILSGGSVYGQGKNNNMSAKYKFLIKGLVNVSPIFP